MRRIGTLITAATIMFTTVAMLTGAVNADPPEPDRQPDEARWLDAACRTGNALEQRWDDAALRCDWTPEARAYLESCAAGGCEP